MPELTWSAQDVRREYNRRQIVLGDRGIGEPIPQWAQQSLTPGAHVVTSPRAGRGHADAYVYWDDFVELPNRVAPVIWIDAGYRATSPCVRAATLVSS